MHGPSPSQPSCSQSPQSAPFLLPIPLRTTSPLTGHNDRRSWGRPATTDVKAGHAGRVTAAQYRIWLLTAKGDPGKHIQVTIPPFWRPGINLLTVTEGGDAEGFNWETYCLEDEFTVLLRTEQQSEMKIRKNKRTLYEMKCSAPDQSRHGHDDDVGNLGNSGSVFGNLDAESDSESTITDSDRSSREEADRVINASQPGGKRKRGGQVGKFRAPPATEHVLHPTHLLNDELYIDLVHILQQPSRLKEIKRDNPVYGDQLYRLLHYRRRFHLFWTVTNVNPDPSGTPWMRVVPMLYVIPCTVQTTVPEPNDGLRATPVSHIRAVLTAWHRQNGHERDCFDEVKKQFYNIRREDCYLFARYCSTCLEESSCKINKLPLKPIVTVLARQRYTLDLTDMIYYQEQLKKNGKGYFRDGKGWKLATQFRYIAHMIDHATRFAWAAALRRKDQSEVESFVNTVWAMHGKPELLHTDNGGEFKNITLTGLCRDWGVFIVRGKPYTPRVQGMIERANRSLKKCIRCLMRDGDTIDWTHVLPMAVSKRNHRRHSSTKQIPARSFPPPLPAQLSRKPFHPSIDVNRHAPRAQDEDDDDGLGDVTDYSQEEDDDDDAPSSPVMMVDLLQDDDSSAVMEHGPAAADTTEAVAKILQSMDEVRPTEVVSPTAVSPSSSISSSSVSSSPTSLPVAAVTAVAVSVEEAESVDSHPYRVANAAAEAAVDGLSRVTTEIPNGPNADPVTAGKWKPLDHEWCVLAPQLSAVLWRYGIEGDGGCAPRAAWYIKELVRCTQAQGGRRRTPRPRVASFDQVEQLAKKVHDWLESDVGAKRYEQLQAMSEVQVSFLDRAHVLEEMKSTRKWKALEWWACWGEIEHYNVFVLTKTVNNIYYPPTKRWSSDVSYGVRIITNGGQLIEKDGDNCVAVLQVQRWDSVDQQSGAGPVRTYGHYEVLMEKDRCCVWNCKHPVVAEALLPAIVSTRRAADTINSSNKMARAYDARIDITNEVFTVGQVVLLRIQEEIPKRRGMPKPPMDLAQYSIPTKIISIRLDPGQLAVHSWYKVMSMHGVLKGRYRVNSLVAAGQGVHRELEQQPIPDPIPDESRQLDESQAWRRHMRHQHIRRHAQADHRKRVQRAQEVMDNHHTAVNKSDMDSDISDSSLSSDDETSSSSESSGDLSPAPNSARPHDTACVICHQDDDPADLIPCAGCLQTMHGRTDRCTAPGQGVDHRLTVQSQTFCSQHCAQQQAAKDTRFFNSQDTASRGKRKKVNKVLSASQPSPELVVIDGSDEAPNAMSESNIGSNNMPRATHIVSSSPSSEKSGDTRLGPSRTSASSSMVCKTCLEVITGSFDFCTSCGKWVHGRKVHCVRQRVGCGSQFSDGLVLCVECRFAGVLDSPWEQYQRWMKETGLWSEHHKWMRERQLL